MVFQDKLYKLLFEIEDVHMCIHGIPVNIKGLFLKYIEMLRVIFDRMRNAEIKFNAKTFSFSLNYIPYLEYLIT